jgi:NitT/TauT family transport system substrate-binding protein
MPTVTFGNSVANIDTSAIQIAQQMGYFKDECLNVKITTLGGSAVANSALQSGSIQFTEEQPLSIYTARQKGLDLLAVAGLDTGYNLYLELGKGVAPDLKAYPASSLSQILTTAKSLKIGVQGSGTTTAPALLNIFAQESNVPKLTPTSFQSTSSEAAALEHGDVDGVFSGPPTSLEAVQTSGARVVLATAKLTGPLSILASAQYAVVTTTSSYAQSNPDIVKRVDAAIAKINNYFIANPSAAAAAVAKAEFPAVNPQVIETAMAAYKWNAGATMTATGWKDDMNLANTYADALGFTGRPVTQAVVNESWTNKYLPAA